MVKNFIKGAAAMLALMLFSATGLVVWVSGDIPTITQLNANFAHIHTTMVGGHGARLINADVSGSAAIASSKLADGVAFPEYHGTVGSTSATCTSGTCTQYNSRGSVVVTHSSTGVYLLTFPANWSQPGAFSVTPCDSAATYCKMNVATSSTNTMTVGCYGGGGTTLTNSCFSYVIWTNN